MLIGYTAYDRAGRRRAGRLEAASVQQAEERLWNADLMVTKVWRVRQLPPLYRMVPTFFGMKPHHLIQFTDQLVSMINSGIPLVRSLNLLQSQIGHPALRDAVTTVVRELSQGTRLSDALANRPEIFPPLYTRMVRIGEEAGNLSAMLEKVAETIRRSEETKGKLKSSLAYSVFVLLMSFGSVLILVGVTIPMMSGLFTEFKADLPLVTRIVLALSDFIQNYGTTLLMLLVALGAVTYLYTRTAKGAQHRDIALMRAPGIGNLVRKSQVAAMADTLSTMLSSGVPLLEALQLARGTSNNYLVQSVLADVHLRLRSGQGLSESLAQHPLVFPALVVETVRIAEETGSLEQRFEQIAKVYQDEAERAVKQMVSMIEPAMIVVVGVMVGFIGVSVISTVYAVLPNIQ